MCGSIRPLKSILYTDEKLNSYYCWIIVCRYNFIGPVDRLKQGFNNRIREDQPACEGDRHKDITGRGSSTNFPES